MPAEYEAIRDKLYRQCLQNQGGNPSQAQREECLRKAKEKAAKVFNSRYPGRAKELHRKE